MSYPPKTSRSNFHEKSGIQKIAPGPSLVDLSDGELFGNDAGEDEQPEILSSYFIDQPSFKNFLSKNISFQIARSRKGMGKSALLAKMAFDLRQDKNCPVVIQTTGADLLSIATPEKFDYLILQGYWKRVICTRINFELGRHFGFAFTDTAMALVESAEIAGFKERNLVGSLLHRIKSNKIPIEVTTPKIGNHEELLKRAMEEYKDRHVWLFIDDIDSTFINTDEQQALTSTFFSACRALVRDVKNLSIRASVRTDVWSNFKKNEDLDKCEQYMTDLSWSKGDLEISLSKKIYSYLVRKSPDYAKSTTLHYANDAAEYLEYVFAHRLKWGGAHVPPFGPVHTLSAGRPRWMAQLCRLAGQEASKRGYPIIGIQEINSVMKVYSRLRLNDLYKEHSHQYHGLQKLIETFAGNESRFSSQELLKELINKYVNPVGSGNIKEIDGVTYSKPVQLAHFLFKTGFLLGRREQKHNPGAGEFVHYEERPELLTDYGNLDDGMLWEVYPSYRNILGIKPKNKTGVRR